MHRRYSVSVCRTILDVPTKTLTSLLLTFRWPRVTTAKHNFPRAATAVYLFHDF